ncbi:MAG: site-specific integrase [Planctomycetes bacterium]|nr:site-specific integrase [Planctomycetota bacterium]
MASISSDDNGLKRLLVVLPDGSRKPIRLGRMTLRAAEAVKVKVEALVAAKLTGGALDDETSRWLASLDDVLLAKLVNLGLAKPRESVTLGAFIDAYIEGRVDVKPRTTINLKQARRWLMSHFESNRALRDITQGDAEDFRLHLSKSALAENTARRIIGRTRQFFRAAIRRGLIQANPFDGIAASMKTNHDKFHYVTREDAQKVLDACPDTQWKLIFALSRYGGLRCPSEHLALQWADVDWERNRIRIPSPKTEHHEGGGSRTIPLFPELLPHLREAFEQAEPGALYIVTHCRGTNANLRTHLQRIIRRAGLEPWPKLFQNLRSTRETELAEKFPMHVVCKWIGNSQAIAAKHYLQLTSEHFDRAVAGAPAQGEKQAAQNAAQQPSETPRNEPKAVPGDEAENAGISGGNKSFQLAAKTFENRKVPRDGLEPSTR